MRTIVLLFQCILCLPALGTENFSIALLGDMPYTSPKQYWENLKADIVAAKPTFVVHVGDIKGSRQPCTADYFHSILKDFEQTGPSWFYTPGDNEWTDCNKEQAGGYNPHERLGLLRRLFASQDTSFGSPKLPLVRQNKEIPENIRWQRENLVFAAIHVVGSGNNFKRQPRDTDKIWKARREEFKKRDAFNIQWLIETFEHAKQQQSPGIMLFIHANPNTGNWQSATEPGFKSFMEQLRWELSDYDKPVALVHGDSHYFRIDKPLRRDSGELFKNFTRVEVFGGWDVHWVRADIDFKSPQLFYFEPQIVQANP